MFNQYKFKCKVCETVIPTISAEEIIMIPGVGYFCSVECHNQYQAKKKAKTKATKQEKAREQVKEIKEELKEQVEMLQIFLPAISEMIAENKDEIIELTKPITQMLTEVYKDLLVTAIVEMDDVRKAATEARVNSIVEATEQLMSKGFSKDQAVALLSK